MMQLGADTDFLAFRPSVIAAAIALLVLRETQMVDVERKLSCCTHVMKVKMVLAPLVLHCINFFLHDYYQLVIIFKSKAIAKCVLHLRFTFEVVFMI